MEPLETVPEDKYPKFVAIPLNKLINRANRPIEVIQGYQSTGKVVDEENKQTIVLPAPNANIPFGVTAFEDGFGGSGLYVATGELFASIEGGTLYKLPVTGLETVLEAFVGDKVYIECDVVDQTISAGTVFCNSGWDGFPALVTRDVDGVQTKTYRMLADVTGPGTCEQHTRTNLYAARSCYGGAAVLLYAF